MSKGFKRVTLTFDFEETKLTDEEAVDSLIDRISDGNLVNWFVQDLPDLGWGRWIER